MPLGDVALAAEPALVGDPQHRVPVDRGVVLRRSARVRRDGRRQVERPPRGAPHLRGVDEAVAAHPDVVVRGGKVGEQVAPLVVGDDDLGVPGRELRRLRHDPDARLRPARPGDDAADVVAVDGHRRARARLGARPRRRDRRRGRDRDGRHAEVRCSQGPHDAAPSRVSGARPRPKARPGCSGGSRRRGRGRSTAACGLVRHSPDGLGCPPETLLRHRSSVNRNARPAVDPGSGTGRTSEVRPARRGAAGVRGGAPPRGGVPQRRLGRALRVAGRPAPPRQGRRPARGRPEGHGPRRGRRGAEVFEDAWPRACRRRAAAPLGGW
jgi:hypothetical protein